MSIYLNNAATTWPKPACVAESMASFMTRGGANLGRGTSSDRDLATLNVVLDCRIRLAELFGGYENADPRYVTFCSGVTEALNVVLKGYARAVPDLRIVTSSAEHNAVVRPLRSLERDGLGVEFAECDSDGLLRPEVLDKALQRRAGLVVLGHANNVCGTIQPLKELAAVCRGRDRPVPLVVDAAQTAGVLPIRAAEWGISAVCFTGHKGLMGPQGTGGIVWNPDFARRVAPLIEGGTGSYSHVEVQPIELPDKFEAGTPNLPGISGLNAALAWLAETGVENIEKRERELGEYFLGALRDRVPGVVLYGRRTMEGRLPVFPLNVRVADPVPVAACGGSEGDVAGPPSGRGTEPCPADQRDAPKPSPSTPRSGYQVEEARLLVDNALLADELSRMGFETRPGLHCAPWSHRTLSSFPEGALRVSPGYFNTEDEIDRFVAALPEAIKKCTRTR